MSSCFKCVGSNSQKHSVGRDHTDEPTSWFHKRKQGRSDKWSDLPTQLVSHWPPDANQTLLALRQELCLNSPHSSSWKAVSRTTPVQSIQVQTTQNTSAISQKPAWKALHLTQTVWPFWTRGYATSEKQVSKNVQITYPPNRREICSGVFFKKQMIVHFCFSIQYHLKLSGKNLEVTQEITLTFIFRNSLNNR